MNKHPSSQLLRFLKAYYKITNKALNNIEGFQHKVWLESFLTEQSEMISEKDVLIRFTKPQIPKCPIPNKNLTNYITIDYCNPELSNVDLLKSLQISHSSYLEIEQDISHFLSNRNNWLNDLVKYENAVELLSNLNDLVFTYNNNSSEFNLVLGNGLLKLNKDGVDIHFPLIQQPVLLVKNTDSSFSLLRAGEPFLNTDTLTSIPGVSAAAIENCIEVFVNNKLDLPGGIRLNTVLTDIFKNITTGNRNLVSLNNSPVLFLSPLNQPFSNIINNLLSSQKSNGKDTALDYFLNCNAIGQNRFNPLKYLSKFSLLEHDLFSINVINSLENENICLVNSRSGTNYSSIIANSATHFLSQGKNVLIIEPNEKYVLNLKKSIPSIFFNNKKSSAIYSNTLYIDDYIEAYSNLEKALNNLKDYSLSKEDYSKELNDDNSGLYWNDEAVYQRGLLIETLKDSQSIIYSIFEQYPYTKNIANQSKIESLRLEWQRLIDLIDNYFTDFERSQKTLKSVNIEINKLLKLNSIHTILSDIVDFIKRKNKLRKIDYTFSREWRNVINSCFINNQQPKTLNDFLLIQLYVEMQIHKNELTNMWNKMMVSIGEAKLPKQDLQLLQCLKSYYTNIINASTWYQNTWISFVNKLIRAGFRWKEFFNQYAQQYIEHDFIETLTNYTLKDLVNLIEARIKFTKEDLLFNTEKRVSKIIDIESCAIDVTACLNPIKSIVNKLNQGYQNKFNSTVKGNLSIKSYQDFIEENIEASEIFYDLIIINNSEKIDVFGILALAVTEKCLVIGDKNQYYKDNIASDSETISELSESLLANVKNNSSFITSKNLYDLIEGICIHTHTLNNNATNPLSVVNCLNRICYDNQLRYLGNRFYNSMLALNMSELFNNDPNNFYDYLLNTLLELNKATNFKKQIIIVDLSDSQYLLLNKLIAEKSLPNITVSNLNGLTNDKFDIVFAIDLQNNNKISKYDTSIKAELCTLLGLTKEFFCYLFSTNNSDLLPVQRNLVDFIEFSSIENSDGTYNYNCLNDLATKLIEYGVNSLSNVLLNNIEIDLIIICERPVLVLDKRKILSISESLVDRLLQLSKSSLQVILVDFEQDSEKVYQSLLSIIDIKSISNSSTSDFNYLEFFSGFNDKFNIIKKDIKNTIDISLKEVATTKLCNDTISKRDNNIVKEDNSNNSKQVYSFSDTDLNNKAAIFNFSENNELDDCLGFEDNPINEDTNVSKVEVDSDNHEVIINSSNITLEKNLTAFDPESDTYDNLYLEKDKIDTIKAQESAFDLLNWLNINKYEYYDFRPDGQLFIVDKPQMRSKLRSLRNKGYYFTLSLNNSQIPNKKSAWILK